MEDLKKWESIIILNPKHKESEKNKILQKCQIIMENYEAEELGMKKLAYEVKGNKEGYYIQFNFEATKEKVAKLEEYFKTQSKIIKFMIIRVEE